MVTHTAYIGSSLWRLSLHEDSPKDESSLSPDILYQVLILTANSYNLHWSLVLTTKRHCGDIEMNHPGDKL